MSTTHEPPPGAGRDAAGQPPFAENGSHARGGVREELRERAKRGPGYLWGVVRTRRGPRITSTRRVLSAAAAEGALAGHTPYGQPDDPGAKAAGAKGVARLRASFKALGHMRAAADDLAQLRYAGSVIERTARELPPVEELIHSGDARVEQLEGELAQLEATQQPPPPPAVPELDEWEEIAYDAVPGYRLTRWVRWSMFVSAAAIEGVFTGQFVSGVATLGVDWIDVQVDLALPWFVGAAVGMLIPALAERAAHLAATAEDDAPWYVRHAPLAAILVPAALGVGRAADMTRDDALAGVLGLGVALLLTGLAIVAAGIGYREAWGEVHDAQREERARLRRERLNALTPGPTQHDLALAAKRGELADARDRVEQLRRERSAMLAEQGRAEADRVAAAARLRVVEKTSELDAEREAGLALASMTTYRLRRDAVAATHGTRRPDAFDAAAWPDQIDDLPVFRCEDLLQPWDGMRAQSHDDDEEGR